MILVDVARMEHHYKHSNCMVTAEQVTSHASGCANDAPMQAMMH